MKIVDIRQEAFRLMSEGVFRNGNRIAKWKVLYARFSFILRSRCIVSTIDTLVYVGARYPSKLKSTRWDEKL